MSRGRKKSLQKRIKPAFYIFCEGETEKEYANFLRCHYRVPIQIKSKVSGNKITQRYISAYLKGQEIHAKDKVFLMYDIDTAGILKKLRQIKNTVLLVSNPCIELWFLLHLKPQTAHISTKKCYNALRACWGNYKKGILDEKQRQNLIDGKNAAMSRARNAAPFKNSSTTIYYLLEEIESI